MAIIHEVLAPKDNADDVLLIRKLYFSNNEKIKKTDELLDLETSKTSMIIDSPSDGFIEYLVEEGAEIKVADVLLRIHDSPINQEKAKLSSDFLDESFFVGNKVISYKANNYIKKNNIDISSLNKNFITFDDVNDTNIVRKAPEDLIEKKISSGKISGTTDLKPSLAKTNEIKALSGVQSSGMVSTIFISINAENISHIYNSDLFKGSSSYLPLIIFESSKLLKKMPLLNAYYDNGIIRIYNDINVGVAFDIDDGLKVYTIYNSDKMTLPNIESTISSGVDRYLNKTLTMEHLTKSTFTVTDLSSFGVDGIIPLINKNQSAIIAISSIDETLNRITLSLSFDHRVTEGKVASQFLVELKQRLQAHSGWMAKKKSASADIDTFMCGSCMKTLDEDLNMRSVGFIPIINHHGEKDLMCRVCWEGW